jgi:hypothetical protein
LDSLSANKEKCKDKSSVAGNYAKDLPEALENKETASSIKGPLDGLFIAQMLIYL